MIREIKVRKSKIGTIIASHVEGFNTPEEAANLEAMNSFAPYVTIHSLTRGGEGPHGVTYIKHKVGPKVKQAIGHYISQIRGDQIAAFVRPDIKFLEDITRVYGFVDANRMERAYGFFIGDKDSPSVVALTGSIIPHLFHAIPDQMDMVGNDWITWIHKWAPKAMMAHRYFDANGLVNISQPEKVPAVSYSLVDESPATPIEIPESAPEPVKRKLGRPKKK